MYLFGQPRLLLDDTPVPIVGRPKVWPLLAYLVLHARSPVTRTVVARTFWPDDDDATALANLRRHLHYLGSLLPRSFADATWITASPRTIAWKSNSGTWCDVIEFERWEREPENFANAAALYAGDLLVGFDDAWIEFDRQAYRVSYLRVLEGLIGVQLARREYAAAEREAQLLLLHDPWRETAVRLLMRIRFEAGDRAGALAAYQRFETRLKDELGTLPMPDTEADFHALLDGRPPPGVIRDASSSQAQPAAPATAGDFPFVGRDRQLETLAALGRATAGGRGSAIAVSGEAGIGKSRLVREAALRFEAAGGAVFAGVTSAPEAVSYQPLLDILRAAAPLVPHLGVAELWLAALVPLVRDFAAFVKSDAAAVEPARERTRLFEACAVFLSALAARRPLMLVLEDLHGAGGATVALVEYLARRLNREPVLIVMTYREDELVRTHALRALRRNSERERLVEHLPLGALSRDDVGALLCRLDAATDGRWVAERLHLLSDGNPLFLGELVRNARELGELAIVDGAWRWKSERTPSSTQLQQTIENRLRRLGDGARLLAAVAAVFGATFDVELLAETTGRPEADLFASLDELIDRRLLVERTAGARFGYAFAHQLVSATIYNGLDTTWLRHQHRRVAMVLQDFVQNGRDEPAAQIAHHWDRAGDFERAAAAYVRAASDAFAVAAYEDGQRLTTRALELTAVPRLRAQALGLSERAASLAGDRTLQAKRLGELESLAVLLDDEDTTLDVYARRLALANLRNARADEEGLIGELSLAAERNGNAAWRAVALEAEVRMCRTSGEYERARGAFDRLLRTAEASGDRNRYVAAFAARADVDIYQGRFDDARRSLDALRALVADTPDRPALVRALMTFARAALARQAYDEMSGFAREAHRISRETGDREGEALALHTLANGMVYPFRVAHARAAYREAREIYDAIGHRVGQACVAVDEGLFHTEVGTLERAFADYERAEAIAAAIPFAWARCVVRINKAYALRLSAAYAAAATAARDALVMARDLGSVQLESAALGTLGAAESELGHLESALEHLHRGVELRRTSDATPRLGDNLCALALALLRSNDIGAAAGVSAELVALHTAHPDLAPQPTEWLGVASRVARATGDCNHAAALARDAACVFRERLARIDDDATRRAFSALPFNRAVADAAGVC